MSAQGTYHIRIRGNVLGPFRREQVLKMIERGQLTRRHEVSCDGSDWQPAGEFPELFPPQSAPAETQARAVTLDVFSQAADAMPAQLGPEVVWYYERDGNQNGPVPASQLAQLIANGVVGPDNRVWRDGMGDWQPVYATELAVHLPFAPPKYAPGLATTHGGSVITKPSIPGVIHAGWILYVAIAFVGLIEMMLGASPTSFEEPPPDAAAALVVLGGGLCFLAVLDICAVVAATIGYAWGAVLQIAVSVISFPVVLLRALAAFAADPVEGLFAFLSFCLAVASLVCFVVPPAWQYYRNCKAYRIASLLKTASR